MDGHQVFKGTMHVYADSPKDNGETWSGEDNLSTVQWKEDRDNKKCVERTEVCDLWNCPSLDVVLESMAEDQNIPIP